MGRVEESCGVVTVNGKVYWVVVTCRNCGACVTLTPKQRDNGIRWLYYLDRNMNCCDSPDYFFTVWQEEGK